LEESHRANTVLQGELAEAGRREERSTQASLQAKAEKVTLETQVTHLESRLKEANAELKQSREAWVVSPALPSIIYSQVFISLQQLKTGHKVRRLPDPST
jgi:hypothetical protein